LAVDAELHAPGIVHRDLKPSNALLAADGSRLIVFGTARALDATKITNTATQPARPAPARPRGAT
jgi:serine/threonine protein kinase